MHTTNTTSPVLKWWPTRPRGDGHTPGVILAATSLLSVMAIAHHPSVAAREPAEIIAGLARLAGTARLVHGALIASMAAQLVAFVDVSRLLGLARIEVRAALIAVATSAAALCCAALLSGFVLPELGAQFTGASAASLEIFVREASLLAIGRQLLSSFGVLAMSVAIALWSWRLLRGSRTSAAVGAFGLIVAAGIPLALLGGLLQLRVPGMILIVAAEGAWNLALAGLLVSGARVTP